MGNTFEKEEDESGETGNVFSEEDDGTESAGAYPDNHNQTEFHCSMSASSGGISRRDSGSSLSFSGKKKSQSSFRFALRSSDSSHGEWKTDKFSPLSERRYKELSKSSPILDLTRPLSGSDSAIRKQPPSRIKRNGSIEYDLSKTEMSDIITVLTSNRPTKISVIMKNYNVAEHGTNDFVTAIKNSSTLTELDLERCITKDNCKAFSKALKKNTTLTSLDLVHNRIYSNGAKDIAKALLKNTTLTRLNLEYNWVGAPVNNYQGSQFISETLLKSKTLKNLRLRGNKIGDIGALFIGGSLQHNTSLTKINLHSNGLSSTGAKYITKALLKNTTLTALNLSSNIIDRADHIAEMLKKNTTLKSLKLSKNRFAKKEIRMIADALVENSTLTRLDFGSNQVSKSTIKYLTGCLIQNRSLAQIGLRNNSINDASALYLAHLFANTTTLSSINLSLHEMTPNGLNIIAESIPKNKSLVEIYFGSIKHNCTPTHNKIALMLLANKVMKKTFLKYLVLSNNNNAAEIFGIVDIRTAIFKALIRYYVWFYTFARKLIVPNEFDLAY